MSTIIRVIFGIILIALIWAIAWVLQLPDWIPAVLTAVLVIAVVAVYIVRRMRAMKAARDIERALSAQAEEHARTVRPEQQAEIQAMQVEFQKAINSLKTSKAGKAGADALYAMPWYMIIGPPGAGKSTALRNSGLQFPYLSAGGGGVKGVGGTRNCEWWLTNDGVILDTAGRYTTEDDDKDEWTSFLDMLKRNRPRKPVNGVIAAVSVGDLGGAHEEDIAGLARRIRERIDEVMQRLQMVVPVYVLFTKCDLIPGFVEMFGDLRKQDRGQIWGFTLPLAERVSDPGGIFKERFEELSKIIESRAFKRLHQERKLDVREKIYEFPQQFDVLKNNLSEFVGQLFAENVYQGTPIIRGCYFTSGTQEGRPIDRVMTAMADAFGIRQRTQTTIAPTTEAKSYFLRDMFSNVVFPDADVAARSEGEIRRERNRRIAFAAGAFGLALLLSVIPGYAYIRNHELVESTGTMADVVKNHPAAAGPIGLDKLEPLRQRLEDLNTWHDRAPPPYMRFGMYAGNDLYPSVSQLYTSTLRHDVVEPVFNADKNSMDETSRRLDAMNSRPSSDEHSALYTALKMHLLLTAPKAEGEPPIQNNTDLRNWLSTQLVNSWSRQISSSDPLVRSQMNSNVQFYLTLFTKDPEHQAFHREPEIVRRVRSILTRIPAADRALQSIIDDVERDGYDVTLPSIVGESVTVVRAHNDGQGRGAKVRAAFTRRGWESRVRDRLSTALEEITGEIWVLGGDPHTQARERETQIRDLRSQYFAAYIAEWHQFLDAIYTAPPADPTEALTMLQELTRGEPPPFGRIMRAAAYNTHLEESNAQAAAGTAQSGVLTAARQRLERAISGQSQVNQTLIRAGLAAGQRLGATRPEDQRYERDDVEAEFIGFTRFGVPPPAPPPPAPGADPNATPPAPPANTSVPLNAYQEQLGFVRNALQTFLDNPNSAQTPMLTALQTARTQVTALIQSQELGWRPLFQNLLQPPIDWTTRRTTERLGGAAGERWCSSVVVPFERTLHDRYPFNPNGHDAALADVADFFRPERGALWTFYGTVLNNDVPRTGDHFEFATRLASVANEIYYDTLPQFLDKAQDVSTVLFPSGSNDPLVQFEVRLRPWPAISNIDLTVDGQAVEYHNGPEQWYPMRWPGEGRQRGASIRVRGQYGIDETIQEDGEWGLFRLIEQGVVHGDPAARIFSVVWTLRDQTIQVDGRDEHVQIGIDIRPARTENPFLGIPRRGNGGQFLQPFRVDPNAGMLVPHQIARSGGQCNVGNDVAGASSPAGGGTTNGGDNGGAAPGHHHHHHHSARAIESPRGDRVARATIPGSTGV